MFCRLQGAPHLAQLVDLIGAHAEHKHVVDARLLGDLDVGAVPGANDEAAVHLGAGRGFGIVRSGFGAQGLWLQLDGEAAIHCLSMNENIATTHEGAAAYQRAFTHTSFLTHTWNFMLEVPDASVPPVLMCWDSSAAGIRVCEGRRNG